MIFLSKYAQTEVQDITGPLCEKIIIPHGVNKEILGPPEQQHPIENYTSDKPFRILYVSIIDVYKHQWHVISGLANLRKKTGWPITLDLIGPAYAPTLNRLNKAIKQHDRDRNWVRYYGNIDKN